ncbi:MAG: hypothetical protein SGILL_008969 [Bacillariaceae sp.]
MDGIEENNMPPQDGNDVDNESDDIVAILSVQASAQLDGIYGLAPDFEEPSVLVDTNSEKFRYHLVTIGYIKTFYEHDALFVQQLLRDELLRTFLKDLQNAEAEEEDDREDEDENDREDELKEFSLTFTLLRGFANRMGLHLTIANYMKEMYACFELQEDKLVYLQNAFDDTVTFAQIIPNDSQFDTVREFLLEIQETLQPLLYETIVALCSSTASAKSG